MDVPTALLRDLWNLSSSVVALHDAALDDAALDDAALHDAALHDAALDGAALDGAALDGGALVASLSVLVDALQGAISSYRGLCLTIVEDGQELRLAAFVPPEDGEKITTSLRLPFAALGPSFTADSRMVFYAATPGAFVDLAADLSYALNGATTCDDHRLNPGNVDGDRLIDTHKPDGGSSVVLDADLPPVTRVSGLAGVDEASAINRAVGLLLGYGHQPDHVHSILRRRAADAGVEPHIYAARLLRR